MFAQLSKGKSTIDPPEFPDWLVDEEPQASGVAKEAEKEKKKRMRSPAKKKQSSAKKKKKVSSEEEELNSEELDELSEHDEEETKRIMKQINSEEESEESSEEDGGSEQSELYTEIQSDPEPNPHKPQNDQPTIQSPTHGPQPISPEKQQPSNPASQEKADESQPQQQPILEEVIIPGAIAAEAIASSVSTSVTDAVVTPSNMPREKHIAKRRPTYYEARANPGAKLAICEEDLVAKDAGIGQTTEDAVAAGAIVAEGRVEEEIPAETAIPAEALELQEFEKEATAKLAELQASKEAYAANADATESNAVVAEKEEQHQKGAKKKKPGQTTPAPKRTSTRLRSGVLKK